MRAWKRTRRWAAIPGGVTKIVGGSGARTMKLPPRSIASLLFRVQRDLRKMGPWRVASLLMLLLMIPLAVRLALDSGISWDEERHLEYGQRLLMWYRSGFKDRSAFTFMDLYLYGGLFDLPAQIVISFHLLPWGVYESRHVLTALVAVLGIVAVWMTANRIAGPRAGFCAAALLTLTPAWVGHGLFNCKDIPFATAVAFVVHFLIRIGMRHSCLTWADAWGSLFSIGCALGVRSGGMFLLGYPIVIVLSRWAFAALARRGEPLRATREAGVAFGRFFCALPVAWGVMLFAWPWAQESPLIRPFRAAQIARHFVWGGLMRFDGRMISTGDIPASYLPVWFGVTLPDIYVPAGLCALALCIAAFRAGLRTPRVRAVILLIAFIAIPYVAVVVTRPVIYDAHRHFLFLLPAIATLAGVAINAFVAAEWILLPVRGAVILSLLVCGAVTAYDMRSLHPYQYLYFNRLSGGLPRQAERFETDYWGLTYREAFAWVVQHVKLSGTEKVHVTPCNIYGPLRYYRKQWNATQFVIEDRIDRSQISIAMLRVECKDIVGTTIHAVRRQGVPLAVVRERAPGDSYADSCRNCAKEANLLDCECRTVSGEWTRTSLSLPCDHAFNDNGHLRCE